MRPKLLLVMATLLITGAVMWLDYSHRNPFIDDHQPLVSTTKAAPTFTFATVDTNQTTQLSELRGRYTLINFWASWCRPCIHEYPMLVELAQRHPDILYVLMLSSDKTPEDALAFSRQMDDDSDPEKLFATASNIFVAWDKNRYVTRELYGTTRYPESILIGPDGSIARKFIGVLTEDDINTLDQMFAQ